MLIIVNARQEKIVWSPNDDDDDDTIEKKIDDFFKLATDNCFPIIK